MNRKKTIIMFLLIGAYIILCGCGSKSSFVSQPLVCTIQNEIIVCPDGSSMLVPVPAPGQNGLNGVDGIDGTQVTIFDPCGDDLTGPDEILLIFSTGEIIAWYKNLGFIVLEPGVVYRTTDAQKCQFFVENNMVVEL